MKGFRLRVQGVGLEGLGFRVGLGCRVWVWAWGSNRADGKCDWLPRRPRRSGVLTQGRLRMGLNANLLTSGYPRPGLQLKKPLNIGIRPSTLNP